MSNVPSSLPKKRRKSMNGHRDQDLQCFNAFTALAADMVVYILEEMQPSDIISLRQTCRAFYQLTKIRTVWINALRSVMERHAIPYATFPLQTMQLPLLEHAALAPHRFLSLLERFDGASLQPITIRVLSPRLTRAERETFNIADNDGLYDVYMEPSGRYLATLTAYDSFTLYTVWDLGVCGNDTIEPRVRYLEWTPFIVYLESFRPGPEGSNIFYLVSVHEPSPFTSLAILVHRLSLSHSSELYFLSKLDIPEAPPFVVPYISHIQGTCRLSVQFDDENGTKIFWIWDFEDNTVAAFSVDCPSKGKETCLCYYDCILITSDNHIWIYNVPALSPRNLVNVPFELKASTIVVVAPKAPESIFIENFYHNEDIPCHLVNISSSRLTFLQVMNSNKFENLKLPNKFPVNTGFIDIKDVTLWGQDQRLMALQKCEDGILLPGYNEIETESGDFFIFTAKVSGASSENLKLVKTYLSNPLSHRDIKVRHFAPLLGRLCIHSKLHSAHFRTSHCIYILDYLSPPQKH